jgi:hypothetical protein
MTVSKWTYRYPQPLATATSSRGNCRSLPTPFVLSTPSRLGDDSADWILSILIVRPTVPVPQTTATTWSTPGISRAGAASMLTSEDQLGPRHVSGKLTICDLDPRFTDAQVSLDKSRECFRIGRCRDTSKPTPDILEDRDIDCRQLRPSRRTRPGGIGGSQIRLVHEVMSDRSRPC